MFVVLASIASAHAATINITGTDYSLGTVTPGQNGTITTVGDAIPFLSYPDTTLAATGLLPSDTAISFATTLTSGVFNYSSNQGGLPAAGAQLPFDNGMGAEGSVGNGTVSANSFPSQGLYASAQSLGTTGALITLTNLGNTPARPLFILIFILVLTTAPTVTRPTTLRAYLEPLLFPPPCPCS
jgi:hypothetical protein